MESLFFKHNTRPWAVGRSENCIFHDRNYPECFFHSIINNKKGEIEKKCKNEILAWGWPPEKNLRSPFGSKIRFQRK